MGRKKRIIYAVEDVCPDTKRTDKNKYLNNFICYESDIKKSFQECSRRNIWKDNGEVNSEKEVEKIITKLANPKKNDYYFYNEDVAIFEPNLSSKIKLTDDYIYRVRFDSCPSADDDNYVTYKEVFPLIQKKVKNKFAIVMYDGRREVIEYSDNTLANIIATMSNTTSTIYIAQLLRDKEEGEWITITIYKNLLKIG